MQKKIPDLNRIIAGIDDLPTLPRTVLKITELVNDPKSSAKDLARGIKSYMIRYNQYRPHQSLKEATPEEIYSGKMKIAM